MGFELTLKGRGVNNRTNLFSPLSMCKGAARSMVRPRWYMVRCMLMTTLPSMKNRHHSISPMSLDGCERIILDGYEEVHHPWELKLPRSI